MYVVKCPYSICKWRLRVVGREGGVRVSQFDTKHMCGSLKKAKDNKHATYVWVARKRLGLCDHPVKYIAHK